MSTGEPDAIAGHIRADIWRRCGFSVWNEPHLIVGSAPARFLDHHGWHYRHDGECREHAMLTGLSFLVLPSPVRIAPTPLATGTVVRSRSTHVLSPKHLLFETSQGAQDPWPPQGKSCDIAAPFHLGGLRGVLIFRAADNPYRTTSGRANDPTPGSLVQNISSLTRPGNEAIQVRRWLGASIARKRNTKL